MSANTALITDAAKAAARQSLADYSAGVFAHITGDWAGHIQARIYQNPYVDGSGNLDAITSLRIAVTDATHADIALLLPAISTGVINLTGSAPIITVQPQDQSVALGQTAAFVVKTISDTPVTYQWFKNNALLPGEIQAQLVLPGLTTASGGSYFVQISNLNGTTQSRVAVLSVLTTPPSSSSGGGSGGFDITDIIFAPFSFF